MADINAHICAREEQISAIRIIVLKERRISVERI